MQGLSDLQSSTSGTVPPPPPPPYFHDHRPSSSPSMVHMRANLLSTQQSSTKIQGTSRIFKTCLLVMLLSLAACLFSLLFEVFYCQSANNDNTEDCR